MPGPYKKKKHHTGDTFYRRKYKTKHRSRDIDQVFEDVMKSASGEPSIATVDEDKPGQGQFYCIYCSRYFIDNSALEDHLKTKSHKRRVKILKTEPYTLNESEKAAGFGSY